MNGPVGANGNATVFLPPRHCGTYDSLFILDTFSHGGIIRSGVGLGDMQIQLSGAGNLATWLCASLVVKLPFHSLAPRHNNNVSLDESVHWSRYFSTTRVEDSSDFIYAATPNADYTTTYINGEARVCEDSSPAEQCSDTLRHGQCKRDHPLHRVAAKACLRTCMLCPIYTAGRLTLYGKTAEDMLDQLPIVANHSWRGGRFVWRVKVKYRDWPFFSDAFSTSWRQYDPPHFYSSKAILPKYSIKYVLVTTTRTIYSQAHALSQAMGNITMKRIISLHVRRGDTLKVVNKFSGLGPFDTSVPAVVAYVQCSIPAQLTYDALALFTDEINGTYVSELLMRISEAFPQFDNRVFNGDKLIAKLSEQPSNLQSKALDNFYTYAIAATFMADSGLMLGIGGLHQGIHVVKAKHGGIMPCGEVRNCHPCYGPPDKHYSYSRVANLSRISRISAD